MDDPNARKKGSGQKTDGYMARRMQDPDMTMFTSGLDLTSFGLNLTDSEYSVSAKF
jgi:hypothetical protein